MGISGLLPELSGAISKCHLSELAGQTAGIDVSGWIHRCLEGKMTPLQYVARKVHFLYRHGITCVLVFDGEDIEAKAGVRAYRLREREKLLQKAEELKKQGNVEEAKKYKLRSTARTGNCQTDIKSWCKKHNVKFVQSPCEADAQLAYLQQHGFIDFVITEDSDLVVYGCDRVLYKLCNEDGDMYRKDMLEKTWVDPFNLDCLQTVCILVGSDFWKPGLVGFGVKSAIKMYSKLAPRFSFNKVWKLVAQLGKTVDKDSFMMALMTFRHQLVVDHAGDTVPLTPYPKGKTWRDFPYAGNGDHAKGEVFSPQSGPINLQVVMEIEKSFNCCLCAAVFSSVSDLKNHRNLVHPIMCHICNRHFNYPGDLVDHLKVHAEKPEANHVCEECGKACITNRQLITHRSKVHKPESHFCPQCQKGFKFRAELERHLLVHSDERKFVCNVCGEGFKQKEGLRNHKAKHSSDKPYVCGKCGRGFASKRVLRAHEWTHNNDKSYVCETCGKGFKSNAGMLQHQVTHSNLRPHKCDICGKGFKRKNTVHRHRRTQHI